MYVNQEQRTASHLLTEDVDLLLGQARPTRDPPQIDQGFPEDPKRNFGTDLNSSCNQTYLLNCIEYNKIACNAQYNLSAMPTAKEDTLWIFWT